MKTYDATFRVGLVNYGTVFMPWETLRVSGDTENEAWDKVRTHAECEYADEAVLYLDKKSLEEVTE